MIFQENEFNQMCQLVSKKIILFNNSHFQNKNEVHLTINELIESILNGVEYPKDIFNDQNFMNNLFTLLDCNDLIIVKDILHLLTTILYNTSGLGCIYICFADKLQNYFYLDSNLISPTFYRQLFSFFSNMFSDICLSNDNEKINEFMMAAFFKDIIDIVDAHIICYESLLFLMLISPYVNSNRFSIDYFLNFINYIYNITFDKRLINNQESNKLRSVALWTMYESISIDENQKYFIKYLNENNKNIQLMNLLNEFLINGIYECLEPILGFFSICIENEKELLCISKENLEKLYILCFSPNGPIQYESIKFFKTLLSSDINELLSLGILNLLDIYSMVEYRTAGLIYEIGCIVLLNINEIHNLLYGQMKIGTLISFVLNNMEEDENRILIGLNSLLKAKEFFDQRNKTIFKNLFEESNGSSTLVQLSELDFSDHIQNIIDMCMNILLFK